MKKRTERTSKKVASSAGKLLRDINSVEVAINEAIKTLVEAMACLRLAKSVAASALTQKEK